MASSEFGGHLSRAAGALEVLDEAIFPDTYPYLEGIDRPIVSSEPRAIERSLSESLAQDSVCPTSAHQLGLPQPFKSMDRHGLEPDVKLTLEEVGPRQL